MTETSDPAAPASQPVDQALPAAPIASTTVTALLRWWWQRYLWGWRRAPLLYIVTELVMTPALLINLYSALLGTASWCRPISLAIPAAAATLHALPWLPFSPSDDS